MNLPWYTVVDCHERLDQRDIIPDCPVVTWAPGPITVGQGDDPIQAIVAATEIVREDLVVMTQTCDLNHRKVTVVTLCRHHALERVRQRWTLSMLDRGQSPSDRGWDAYCDGLREGRVPNCAMLNGADSTDPEMGHRIVEFERAFTIPRDFLESWLSQTGQRRLRLCPPYREHLSQAFARYYMRVGLPTDIQKVW